MKKLLILLFIFTLLPNFMLSASAEIFKVALMDVPNKEMFKELFEALSEVTDNIFEVKVYPFARATNLLEENLVDIVVPKIKSNNNAFNKTLKYDFSNAKSGNVIAFVLYTNKNNPVDIDNLRKGNTKRYKIETDGPNIKYFGFTALFSRKAEHSLQAVASGRIDGCIYSQNTGDAALKKLNLKNIRRQLWEHFDVSFTLQKGQAGGKLDKILIDGINKLRANGKLELIMGEQIRTNKYKDWQPQ